MATQTTQWSDSAAAITALSTTLNSLANGGLIATAALAALTDVYMDLELLVGGFGGSINQNTKVAEIYAAATVDGTNYPDGFDASVTPQASTLIGALQKVTANGTGACRLMVFGVPTFARAWKMVVKNTSGQAFASSGNTLVYRSFTTASVAA